MVYRLDELPYRPDGLEPHLGAGWVETQRGWQEGYVKRLSGLLAGTAWDGLHTAELLRRLHELPEELREPVRENAGGHLNHHLLLCGMGPDGGGEPGYELLDDIEAGFGSFPAFQAAVERAANELRGEGWVWLVWTGGGLDLETTELEHTPIGHERAPLVGVDLWRHACEDTFPDRSTYLAALWHVVDWRVVAERLLEAEETTREHRGSGRPGA